MPSAGSSRPPSHVVARGSKGAGPAVVSVARAGDIVVGVYNNATLGNASAGFETVVTVNGQVQQTAAGDASGSEFVFFLMPQS